MIDDMPCLLPDGGANCFPLHFFLIGNKSMRRAASSKASPPAPSAVTLSPIAGLCAISKAAYPGEEIAKEDIFYYVYGLLHFSRLPRPLRRQLTKELPRIPLREDLRRLPPLHRRRARASATCTSTTENGRATLPRHIQAGPIPAPGSSWTPRPSTRVTKMKFGGKPRRHRQGHSDL